MQSLKACKKTSAVFQADAAEELRVYQISIYKCKIYQNEKLAALEIKLY